MTRPHSPAPPPLARPPRLPLLDGLRTLAAIGVMLFHVPVLGGSHHVFGRGYLLVDLFFLLSGFVLTLSAEPAMQRGMTALQFLRKRLIRLWPLIALGAVLGALVFAGQTSPVLVVKLLPLALLMIPLPNTANAPVYPLNGPQWSLLWELVANVVHAALLHRLSDRALLAIAATSGAALATACLALGTGDIGPVSETWTLAIFRIGWSYTLGCWMARKFTQRRPAPLAHWSIALALPVAVTLLLPFSPWSKGTGDALILIVALPVCFWIAATATPPESHRRWLERFGLLSFPLYAVHVPIVVAFRFWSDTPLPALASVICALIASALIARIGPAMRARAARLLGAGNRTQPIPYARNA